MEQGKCGNLLKLMMGTALAELVDFLVVIFCSLLILKGAICFFFMFLFFCSPGSDVLVHYSGILCLYRCISLWVAMPFQ